MGGSPPADLGVVASRCSERIRAKARELPLRSPQNLPPLVGALLPSLAGSLASFPLPEFLGLGLSGVESSRTGQFMVLYANLVSN